MTVKLAIAANLDELEGDFVETGVYTGSISIFMSKVLATCAADGNRSLWSCDSFKGLPAEDNDMMRIANDTVAHDNIIGEVLEKQQSFQGQFAASSNVSERNIRADGLEQLKRGKIKILEGLFH